MPVSIESGDKGPEIKKLQQNLATLGYTAAGRLKADGKFGPLTEIALKSFQEDNDLKADRIYGPKTQDAIDAKLLALTVKPTREPSTAAPRVARTAVPTPSTTATTAGIAIIAPTPSVKESSQISPVSIEEFQDEVKKVTSRYAGTYETDQNKAWSGASPARVQPSESRR